VKRKLLAGIYVATGKPTVSIVDLVTTMLGFRLRHEHALYTLAAIVAFIDASEMARTTGLVADAVS